MMVTPTSVRAPQAADWALARGRSNLSSGELAELLDVPIDQVRRRLHEPTRRGEWVHPAPGLWLPVPPEYRLWGAPPGIEVIDHLARHVGFRYYVGWLSAAALHGVAHQAPQVFQVATSRLVRDRTVGRTRFEFHTRQIDGIPVVRRETRSGWVLISSVTATMLDVASDPSLSGGIDNAATVIVELSETDDFAVAGIVAAHLVFRSSAVRRLGWILERFADPARLFGLDKLRAVALAGPRTAARLDPTRDLLGPVDQGWLVRVNREVEPDL